MDNPTNEEIRQFNRFIRFLRVLRLCVTVQLGFFPIYLRHAAHSYSIWTVVLVQLLVTIAVVMWFEKYTMRDISQLVARVVKRLKGD
ncbi:hypothetical protein LTR08_007028 [Meristemomyces frigidus]|nr:hypothetical protein LTR08_007028 [Meristemomyces frigidus]